MDSVSWEQFKSRLCESEARWERTPLTRTMTALLDEEERCPGGFREDIQECKEQMLGAEVRMPK